jgi:hypothetical protein
VWWSLGNIFRYKILVSLAVWFWVRPTGYATIPSNEDGDTDETPVDIFGSHSTEKLAMAVAMTRYLCQPGRHRIWTGIGFIWIAFICFLGLTTLGVWFSSIVLDDGTALWSSQHCGVYDFDDSNGDQEMTRNDVYNLQKEARAGEYARSCYGSFDSSNLDAISFPMQCGTFYQSKLRFNKWTTPGCPHFEGNICKEGPLSITFDTGIIDSGLLGINVPKAYKFRRNTTCSILDVESHVKESLENGTTKYYYDFGRKRGWPNPYTYYTVGRPFDSTASGYSLK